MKCKQLLVPAAALMIALPGCQSKKQVPEDTVRRDEPCVDVTALTPDAFTRYGVHPGKITPLQEVQLVCHAGGRVEKLKVTEGASVKAGASLASIDSAKAIIGLRTARLQERIAYKNLQQTKKHLADGNASQIAVDQAELAFLIAKSGRIDAQKKYSGAFAVTPISGIVTVKHLHLYQEVSPGAPTFTIAQTAIMKVVLPVDKSEARDIKPGSSVEITPVMNPDTVLHGTVKTVTADGSPENTKFNVEIHINNKGGKLASGTAVTVNLAPKQYAGALCLPTKLVRNDGVRQSIMVVKKDNTVFSRKVTTGPQSDSLTLILDGLAPGDRIITSGYRYVSDGMRVHIREYPCEKR